MRAQLLAHERRQLGPRQFEPVNRSWVSATARSPFKGLDEGRRRGCARRRLPGDGLHHRKAVLDPVVQLAQEQPLPGLGLVALGDLDDNGRHGLAPSRPAP